MKKYIYDGKEYFTIFDLRAGARQFVMPDDVSDELLVKMGIEVVEYEPEVAKDNLEAGMAKAARDEMVRQITVTVDGMVFDGNETAQSRMARKISGWPENTDKVRWKLADDTIAEVTIEQLIKALELSVSKMGAIWLDGE